METGSRERWRKEPEAETEFMGGYSINGQRQEPGAETETSGGNRI